MRDKVTNIVIFIVLALLSALLIFVEPLNDLDELWQYSFANNIANGLVPYKDFNIIVTPLFSFIAAIFLKVFTNQLIVMRIFNTLVFALILYFACKIFNLLKINKLKSFIYTFILYLLFYYDLGVEYNYLVLLITLISLYIELYNINKRDILEPNHDLLLGILVGLCVVTKHSIGAIIAFMFVCYKAIFIQSKEQFKCFIKIFIYRAIGVVIPVLIFFVYLLANNALNNFINYAILGITEFSNKVPYIWLLLSSNKLINIFAILVPITLTLIIILFSCRKEEKYRSITIILLYSIVTFVGMFPIANTGHFIIYGYIGIIATIYILDRFISAITNKIKINNKFKIFIKYFVLCFCITFICIYIINKTEDIVSLYKNNNICTNELKHYYGIIADNNLMKRIESVGEYIENENSEGKEVRILDSTATLYMLPIDKYNKDYDLFNKGNFGKNGEERLINDISSSKNTQYLILKDKYGKNWQTPIDIIDFVKENKTKIGAMEIFDIYE